MPLDHTGLYPVSSQMGFSRGVVLLDDCEGTFNWTATGTGSDFAASYETDAAFMGTKGMKLVTKTTTPADGDYVQVRRYMPYPEADLMTMRMRVALEQVSDCEYVYFIVYPYDGVNQYQASILWAPNAGAVWIRESGGGYIEIPGSVWAVVDGAWVTMEMTLNLADFKYVSAMFNGVRGDMSAFSMDPLGANTNRYMRFEIKIVAIGPAITTVFFDFIYAGEYIEL